MAVSFGDMSRALRIELENGLYHVTVRGWERRVIVDSDQDCEDWLRLLDRVATRCNWRVLAWVLMSHHFHFFCELRPATCQRECTT